MELDAYQTDNPANWSDRARVHAASTSYDLARYAAEPDHLSDVARFDDAEFDLRSQIPQMFSLWAVRSVA